MSKKQGDKKMSNSGANEVAEDSGRELYENEALGASFTLPKQFTVRQNLTYKGIVGRAKGDDYFIEYWRAGQKLLEDWQSELIPDFAAVDIETETDPRIADTIFWAANTIARHMMTLTSGGVEKNS